MSIYRPAPVSDFPELHAPRWTIWQLPDGDRHIVATVMGEGRVSSKIIDYDKTTRTFTTVSGRKYHLVGESSYDMTSAYVFDVWCDIHKIGRPVDVTEEYEGDLS